MESMRAAQQHPLLLSFKLFCSMPEGTFYRTRGPFPKPIGCKCQASGPKLRMLIESHLGR